MWACGEPRCPVQIVRQHQPQAVELNALRSSQWGFRAPSFTRAECLLWAEAGPEGRGECICLKGKNWKLKTGSQEQDPAPCTHISAASRAVSETRRSGTVRFSGQRCGTCARQAFLSAQPAVPGAAREERKHRWWAVDTWGGVSEALGQASPPYPVPSVLARGWACLRPPCLSSVVHSQLRVRSARAIQLGQLTRRGRDGASLHSASQGHRFTLVQDTAQPVPPPSLHTRHTGGSGKVFLVLVWKGSGESGPHCCQSSL